MKIFSKLFDSSSDIENQLEEQNLSMFQRMMGMSLSQAKNFFRDMLEQAKEESIKEGTDNLPQNFGDILLEKESTDDETKVMLAKKREEGVRDEDIRWWWSLNDLERRIMLKVDDIHRGALYMDSIEKGLSEDESASRVRKYHPMYGNPDDISNTNGDDRPLPYELKDRVNNYIEKRVQNDIEEYKKEFEESSTFNSFVRKEISLL